jgi:hypothetical protein
MIEGLPILISEEMDKSLTKQILEYAKRLLQRSRKERREGEFSEVERFFR